MIPEVRRELLRVLKSPALRDTPVLARSADEEEFLINYVKGASGSGFGTASCPDGSLRSYIAACDRCSGVTAKKFGFGTGGNGIMILLHPPAMLSGLDRKEYREESTVLLRKMMEAIDVDLQQCYVTSLIKCESNDAVSLSSALFNNCEEILARELEIMCPRVAIVMGDMVPLKRIIDANPLISWYCLDHPIALIKNPDLKRKAWNTLKIVRQRMAELSATGNGA